MEKKPPFPFDFLVFFLIIYFFKKELDVFVNIHYPTYEKIPKNDYFWEILLNIRRFMNLSTLAIMLYALLFFNFNTYLSIIIVIIILNCIRYFLFDERFIYYFTDKNNQKLNRFVNIIDIYGSFTLDAILLTFSIYTLFKVFNPFKK
jgi:hypothetical protein